MKSDRGAIMKKPDLKTTACILLALLFAVSVAVAAAVIFGPNDLKVQERPQRDRKVTFVRDPKTGDITGAYIS